MRKEDRIGISSLVFTPKGEAFYQCSSSELQRVSVAAANVLEAKGRLHLAPNARYEIKDDVPIENRLKNTLVIGENTTTAITSPTNKGDANADTDSVVARQNRLNEKQAQGK